MVDARFRGAEGGLAKKAHGVGAHVGAGERRAQEHAVGRAPGRGGLGEHRRIDGETLVEVVAVDVVEGAAEYRRGARRALAGGWARRVEDRAFVDEAVVGLQRLAFRGIGAVEVRVARDRGRVHEAANGRQARRVGRAREDAELAAGGRPAGGFGREHLVGVGGDEIVAERGIEVLDRGRGGFRRLRGRCPASQSRERGACQSTHDASPVAATIIRAPHPIVATR